MPRPAPRTDDDTALRFLDAGARLIDSMLSDQAAEQPRHVAARKFPVALDWLRVEDVVREAQVRSSPGASRRAFRNRWPQKDDFIVDVTLHTLTYRDHPRGSPMLMVADLVELAAGDPAAAVIEVANRMSEHLRNHPRSLLLPHIGALLPHHPDLHQRLLDDLRTDIAAWLTAIVELIEALGLDLRPPWDAARLLLSLQSLLDGTLIRWRVQPEDVVAVEEPHSLLAQTISAVLIGVIDSGSGLSSEQLLARTLGSGPAAEVR